MYILAGKKKLAQVREGEAAGTGRKSKTEPDFRRTLRQLKIWTANAAVLREEASRSGAYKKYFPADSSSIRLLQNNDTTMVEKIQTTIVNTIPLWKSQMVLALGIAHSAEAVRAQREVTDLTNELLRKNAQTLKMATIETAKESERGVVDIETFQQTNADLISTLDEVMKIQRNGRMKRQQAEREMRRMEGELRQKLLEIQR